MKVVLLGYMTSGKSTIAEGLSQQLHIPCIDLDAYIEKRENKTVRAIFESQGELYFRSKEHHYLKEVLNKEDNLILALGGGTPCYANNMALINSYEDVLSIYLKATIKTIIHRLQNGQTTRPLVSRLSKEALPDFVAKHLFERSFFYEQASVQLKIENKSPNQLIDEIIALLAQNSY